MLQGHNFTRAAAAAAASRLSARHSHTSIPTVVPLHIRPFPSLRPHAFYQFSWQSGLQQRCGKVTRLRHGEKKTHAIASARLHFSPGD